MKKLFAVAASVLLCSGLALAQDSIYDFKVKDYEGNDLSLSDFKGQVMLIVNTATKCGFTPQYKELQALYDEFHAEGLEILDFPCNQFGGQAPGDMAQIREFCQDTYNTAFEQLQKVDVNGPDAEPLFVWLYSRKGFSGFGKGTGAVIMDKMLKSKDADYASKPDIKWNFTKFLVNREGEVVARFEPTVSMKEVAAAVKETLVSR